MNEYNVYEEDQDESIDESIEDSQEDQDESTEDTQEDQDESIEDSQEDQDEFIENSADSEVQDEYTEVSVESWGSRIGGSLGGIIV